MSNVFLAFVNDLDVTELYTLKRQYLPLGKIGGFPAWLNPVNLPEINLLACSICKEPMTFLLQIYCTSDSSPSHAFHRSLFIFICRNVKCCKTNDASNFVVLRCQLPRKNSFYSSESAIDPWVVGDVPDPFYNESTFAKICRVCGCKAIKKCAKCHQQWYCSREHQLIDWNNGGHKEYCGNIEPEQGNLNYSTNLNSERIEKSFIKTNPFIFNEYGIEMDVEVLNKKKENLNVVKQDSDNDSDNSNSNLKTNDAEKLAKKMNNLKAYENTGIKVNLKEFEALEESVEDVAYKKFQRIVCSNPTQILRYQKGGEPLLATDYSPYPELIENTITKDINNCKIKIPVCELCGAKRQFELQLMPHLLSVIDENCSVSSIDWATVMIFTCSRDCKVAEDGYVKEFVVKQDFVVKEN